ncbi:MAG: P-loop NTPase [Actinomycetota bacterium]
MARRGRLILIIDPDLDFVEDTRLLLNGERLLTARSLEEAEEIAVGGRVDAAVLGPSFGNEAGVRAAGALLGVDPGIHLVLAANVVTNRLLLAALQTGFGDVVDTPLTVRKLGSSLTRRSRAETPARLLDVLIEVAPGEPVTASAPVPPAAAAVASTAPAPRATSATQDSPQGAAATPAPAPGVMPAAVTPSQVPEARPASATVLPAPPDPALASVPPTPAVPEVVLVAPAPAAVPVPAPVVVAPMAAAAEPAVPAALPLLPAEVEALLPPPPPMAPPRPQPAESLPPPFPPLLQGGPLPAEAESVELPPLTAPEARPPVAFESEPDEPPLRPMGESRVIVVMAGKGGSGKSVVATNLALALTFAVGEDAVAIVDADLQFGDVALLLQMDPVRSVAEVASQVDDLSEARLDALLLRHESGLRVLPAPPRPATGSVAPKAVVQVVEKMRCLYRYVVVDTGSVLDDVLLTLLDHADDVIVVVDMDLSSVKNAKVALDILRAGGYPMERLRLVVNRINAKARLDLAELERSLGLRTAAAIPSDRLVPQSVNEGIPVVALRPRSRVARAFTGLARLFLPGNSPKGS